MASRRSAKTELALAGGGTRDDCIGWRPTAPVRGHPSFEESLDAAWCGAASDYAEHGVRLKLRVSF